MDRLVSFGGNIKQLPVGYTFCPSDEVFVGYYLKRKALSRTIDYEVVPEFDVFSTEPKKLPSGGRIFLGNKFFFCDLKDHVFENIDKRGAGCGQWRTTGEAKDIIVARKNKVIGKRNKLAFWRKRGSKFIKTKWVMHEYRFYLPAPLPNPSQMSSWAGYKIFLRKGRRSKKKARTSCNEEHSHSESDDNEEFEEEEEDREPSEVNLAVESGSSTGPPSPSCSESESVTLRQ